MSTKPDDPAPPREKDGTVRLASLTLTPEQGEFVRTAIDRLYRGALQEMERALAPPVRHDAPKRPNGPLPVSE
jgi:hypothetical protein